MECLINAVTDKIRNTVDIDEKIRMLNEIRLALHEVSPFKCQPVDCVLWVKGENVIANNYNPNEVAPPEMKLLEISILADGYTQPIVAHKKDSDTVIVVDGYHRNRVGKECGKVKKTLQGYLPITIINDKTGAGFMASTVRHNRARGVHRVIGEGCSSGMNDIVTGMVAEGWTDADIAKELGMTAEELLRLKQTKGVAEMLKAPEYAKSWERSW